MNYFNYYTEIEDAFVRRRGKHLLLSPLDWALIESWKQMGVPLHVALRGIEKSFDSYEARPRRRSVKTLFYCQEEVEAQYQEWLEMRRGGKLGEEGVGEGKTLEDASRANIDDESDASLPFPRAAISAHLSESRAGLEDSISRQSARGEKENELTEALKRAASRLAALEDDFNTAARPDAEGLEAALTDIERLIDEALRSCIAGETVDAARKEAKEQLRPYASRMEKAVYEQTLENLVAKSLRERCGLPRLSLFYL